MGSACSMPPPATLDSVIWLDSNVNKTIENLELQHRLCMLVQLLSIFENVSECEQHIRQIPSSDRIILIVSDSLGKELIPRIHEVQQLTSIYVFCAHKPTDQSWATPYSKVKKCF